MEKCALSSLIKHKFRHFHSLEEYVIKMPTTAKTALDAFCLWLIVMPFNLFFFHALLYLNLTNL